MERNCTLLQQQNRGFCVHKLINISTINAVHCIIILTGNYLRIFHKNCQLFSYPLLSCSHRWYTKIHRQHFHILQRTRDWSRSNQQWHKPYVHTHARTHTHTHTHTGLYCTNNRGHELENTTAAIARIRIKLVYAISLKAFHSCP